MGDAEKTWTYTAGKSTAPLSGYQFEYETTASRTKFSLLGIGFWCDRFEAESSKIVFANVGVVLALLAITVLLFLMRRRRRSHVSR